MASYSLVYDGTTYTRSRYKRLKTTRSKSMVSEDCTINTLSALIQSDDLPYLAIKTLYGQDYAPEGYDAYVIPTGKDIRNFTAFDPVLLKKGDTIIGKYFVTSIVRENDNWFTLEACSSIGILDRLQHNGGLYTSTTFGAVLQDIMGAVPYSVPDTTLNNAPVSGWLPMATARQNLESLLFALGAAATYNASGDLVFKYNQPDISYDLSNDYIFRGGEKTTYPTKAKKVVVIEHAWFKDDSVEAETLYDNTGGTTLVNALISFDEPCHSLAWTGTSMTPVNVNCCYITGTGTLTGKKYAHTRRELVQEDASATGGEIRVENATLISSLNSLNTLKRLYNYYHNAIEINYTVKSDGNFKCGDLLNFDDPYGEHTFGYVKDMNDNISSNVKTTAKIVSNWQPTGLGNTYQHSMILKASDLVGGVWNVPSAMRGNPALVVLFGGFGGGQGGYNGTGGETRWFDPYTEDFADYLPYSGVGGNAGIAGAYPKYIIGEYSALANSYSVSFGSGGTGGAANGGAGGAGGHSVFGTYDTNNGEQLTGEYINLLDGTVIASKGQGGFRGGNGGTTITNRQGGTSVIERGSSGHLDYEVRPPKCGNGGSVGSFLGGQGCYGGLVSRNDGRDDYYSGPGAGGGGAAYGATGNDAHDFKWNAQHSGLAMAQAGDGANAVAPADAVLGKTGAGGNGGGGGGAGGIALGLVGTGTYPMVAGNHSGAGGAGSQGGKGSDGFALIYY